MKYIFAKRSIRCRQCGTNMERGELYIKTSYRNKTTGRYYSFNYHYLCYIEYFTEKVRKDALYWMNLQQSPKKLGRPRKYTNSKDADRLRALIFHHRKAGNIDKVEELGKLLKGLRIA